MLASSDNYFTRANFEKNYKEILFIANRNLQSAELNELQYTIREDLKRISTYLVKNGSVVSGGEVTKVSSTSVNIKETTVFVEGEVIYIPASLVNLGTAQAVILGVDVSSVVITDNEDPDLREPYQDVNYGAKGAARRKVIGKWSKTDTVEGNSVFFPVFTIKDGNVLSKTTSTQQDQVRDMIGEYDYQTRGSYVLEGYDVNYIRTIPATGEYQIKLNAGEARVQGHLIQGLYDKTLNLDALTDYSTVLGEPHIYSGSKPYTIRNPVGFKVTSVQGVKEVTKSITHGGYAGASDIVPNTPLFLVVSVTQAGVTFQPTTDFIVQGDQIVWTPAGAEPDPGSLYVVKFQYVHTFDATLTANGKQVVIDGGNVLVTGSTMYVTYEYYNHRTDRLSLDNQGQPFIIKGTPNYPRAIPPKSLEHLLNLCYIELRKNQVPIIFMTAVINVSMNDMKNLLGTVSEMRYNIARLALLEDARSFDPTTNKKNLMVDPLIDRDMMDDGQTNTVQLINREAHMGSGLQGSKSLEQIATMNYTNIMCYNQPRRSGDRLINPYAEAASNLSAFAEFRPSLVSFTIWSGQPNVVSTATNINVRLWMFDAGEDVEITVFNTSYIRKVNSTGELNTSIAIPIGTGVGTYRATVRGLSSGAMADDTLRIISTILFPPIRIPWRGWDPVSQTFTFEEDLDLSEVELFVTQKPSDALTVKIVETRVGIPDFNAVIAVGTVPTSAISANSKVKIPLMTPAQLVAYKEYAVIVVTRRPVGKIGIYKTGEYDLTSSKRYTNQAAQGVLLISANESTWTPVQDEDMTLFLYRCNYQTTETPVDLITANVSNTSDWMLTTDFTQPQGSKVRFQLVTPSGTFNIVPNELLITPKITGNVILRARITAANARTAPLIREGTTLAWGGTTNPSRYTQRQFLIPNAELVPAKVQVLIEQYVVPNTEITVELETSPGVWDSMARVGAATDVGNGFQEVAYQKLNVSIDRARIRINMSVTGTTTERPKFKNVRTIVS